VADADPGAGTDNAAQTTGVAVDDAGNVYVSWYDKSTGVLLSSSDDGSSFTRIETPDTSGGGYPSLAVSADGSRIFLAWYDLRSKDLLLGVHGEVGDLLIAQPSPTPEGLPTQAPPTDCKPDGTDLQIVALGSAFDLNCLAVQAGKDFSVTLDNQDALPHDFSIYPSAADLTNALFNSFTEPNLGSGTNTYGPIPALDAGTYYFQCDYHPLTMFGNFIVTKK